MNLRKTRSADVAVETAPEPVATPGSKGRPTPKRRESTVVRGPVTAPKTRKEALARQKQLAKEARTARRAPAVGGPKISAAQRREAMKAGDPAFLPRRDKGKTRKLARDYVDSHRMISGYMLWLFPIMIIGAVIPILSLVTLVLFLVFLIEWYSVGKRIRDLAISSFGASDGGGPMAVGFYAGSRAYLPRRWRLPAPQVERGAEI